MNCHGGGVASISEPIRQGLKRIQDLNKPNPIPIGTDNWYIG